MKNKNKTTGARVKSHQGPQVILTICGEVRMDIILMEAFLTNPHHDVSGARTFITPRSGEKMRGIIK